MRAQTRVKCLLLQKRFSRSLPLDEHRHDAAVMRNRYAFELVI